VTTGEITVTDGDDGRAVDRPDAVTGEADHEWWGDPFTGFLAKTLAVLIVAMVGFRFLHLGLFSGTTPAEACADAVALGTHAASVIHAIPSFIVWGGFAGAVVGYGLIAAFGRLASMGYVPAIESERLQSWLLRFLVGLALLGAVATVGAAQSCQGPTETQRLSALAASQIDASLPVGVAGANTQATPTRTDENVTRNDTTGFNTPTFVNTTGREAHREAYPLPPARRTTPDTVPISEGQRDVLERPNTTAGHALVTSNPDAQQLDEICEYTSAGVQLVVLIVPFIAVPAGFLTAFLVRLGVWLRPEFWKPLYEYRWRPLGVGIRIVIVAAVLLVVWQQVGLDDRMHQCVRLIPWQAQ
jgi:hypothetical protein